MRLGEILDRERERQGLSINALARAAGMSPGRVQEVLKGGTPDPQFSTVVKLLGALGKSLAWLGRELKSVE